MITETSFWHPFPVLLLYIPHLYIPQEIHETSLTVMEGTVLSTADLIQVRFSRGIPP